MPEGELSANSGSWVQDFERHLSFVPESTGDLLPAYPAVALKIQDLVTGGADLAEVARVVGADSALAANVLRCANSATSQRASRAETLFQAVTHVGAQQVFRLALASELAARALASGPLAPLRRRCWISSLASAAICQELAPLRRLPPSHAFLLGLLHDFGKIVVLWATESFWPEHPGPSALPVDVVDQLAERHHVSLGVALAQKWKFPDLLQEVIAVHHQSAHAPLGPFPELIATSDRIVEHMARSPALTPVDLARLPGIRGADECNAVARLSSRIPEFITSFEPEEPARSHHEVAAPRPQATPVRPLPAPIPAKVTVRNRLLDYSAVAIAPEMLIVEGPDEIPEHQLLRVTLLRPLQSLEMWCLSGSVEPAAGGFVRAELHPYALDGAGRASWADLVSQHETPGTARAGASD